MNHSSSDRFPRLNDSPELCLLVYLARTKLDSDHSAQARDLVRGRLDWDRFLALAWRHGLMPLVFSHLLNSFAELVSVRHLQKVRDDFQHNTARNLMLANELCGMLEAFEEHGTLPSLTRDRLWRFKFTVTSSCAVLWISIYSYGAATRRVRELSSLHVGIVRTSISVPHRSRCFLVRNVTAFISAKAATSCSSSIGLWPRHSSR